VILPQFFNFANLPLLFQMKSPLFVTLLGDELLEKLKEIEKIHRPNYPCSSSPSAKRMHEHDSFWFLPQLFLELGLAPCRAGPA
jgi:hypothetical protein